MLVLKRPVPTPATTTMPTSTGVASDSEKNRTAPTTAARRAIATFHRDAIRLAGLAVGFIDLLEEGGVPEDVFDAEATRYVVSDLHGLLWAIQGVLAGVRGAVPPSVLRRLGTLPDYLDG